MHFEVNYHRSIVVFFVKAQESLSLEAEPHWRSGKSQKHLLSIWWYSPGDLLWIIQDFICDFTFWVGAIAIKRDYLVPSFCSETPKTCKSPRWLEELAWFWKVRDTIRRKDFHTVLGETGNDIERLRSFSEVDDMKEQSWSNDATYLLQSDNWIDQLWLLLYLIQVHVWYPLTYKEEWDIALKNSLRILTSLHNC